MDSIVKYSVIVSVVRLEEKIVFSGKSDIDHNISQIGKDRYFHFHSKSENIFFKFDRTEFGSEKSGESNKRGSIGHGEKSPPIDGFIAGKSESNNCLVFSGNFSTGKK